jgi:hypothetical protein
MAKPWFWLLTAAGVAAVALKRQAPASTLPVIPPMPVPPSPLPAAPSSPAPAAHAAPKPHELPTAAPAPSQAVSYTLPSGWRRIGPSELTPELSDAAKTMTEQTFPPGFYPFWLDGVEYAIVVERTSDGATDTTIATNAPPPAPVVTPVP